MLKTPDEPVEPEPWASVLVVSGSVGAGHDGAAHELARRLRALGVRVDVEDHLRALVPGAGLFLRQGYTQSVGRVPGLFEWLFGVLEDSPFWRWLLALLCRTSCRRLLRWSRRRPYSLVVSTYPLASQALGHLRARGRLRVPVVTYLCDPAAHRSWVHPGVDHHWTVTEATARQGRRDYGVAMRAVGPLVPERFTTVPAERGAQLRAELGIDGSRRVALLVAGSLGLGDVAESAARVGEAGLVPMVLCGRNEALRAEVARVPGAVALGWRSDVHELLGAADVLVQNAGGLSYTEALVAGLPAVSYRCIPGHGRANAAVLEAARLAPWARTDAELAPALRSALARGRSRPDLGDPAEAVLSLLVPADPRAVEVVDLTSRRWAARASRPLRPGRVAGAALVSALLAPVLARRDG
ncbi:MGDG synthase family glycosyltransferase [Quadrisphaera sp. KR29]|uniref:MGDG synthase family glycosyltransferase n=1 Tax=Quadrisphaera sp. KR29 TaxID=3461391 RepID=UPI0040448493